MIWTDLKKKLGWCKAALAASILGLLAAAAGAQTPEPPSPDPVPIPGGARVGDGSQAGGTGQPGEDGQPWRPEGADVGGSGVPGSGLPGSGLLGSGLLDQGHPSELERLAALRTQLGEFLKDRASRDVVNPVQQLDDLFTLAERRLAEMKDSQAELFKQERLQGKIHPEERILVKHRTLQNSIYMKWLRGEKKGRELLFADHMNDGRIMFAAAGSWIFRSRVMELDPTSASALEGTRLPHTEYTVAALTKHFVRDWRRALDSRDRSDLLGVRYRGSWKPLRKKVPACHVFDIWYRAVDWQGDPYDFRHVLVGFDPESLIPVVFEGYRVSNPGQEVEREEDLMARYHFHDFEADPGLDARDFSQTNPNYRFSKR